MSEYYDTPSLEEFEDGFEFEVKVSGGKWVPVVYDSSKWAIDQIRQLLVDGKELARKLYKY